MAEPVRARDPGRSGVEMACTPVDVDSAVPAAVLQAIGAIDGVLSAGHVPDR